MVGLLTLLAQTPSPGSDPASGSSSIFSVLLPLLLMGGIFYFLLIRPQKKRQQAQRDLVQSLDVGDDVVTIGGMHGSIRRLDDDEVTLEVAPGVEVRFLRAAIARKLVEEGAFEPSEDEEAGDQS